MNIKAKRLQTKNSKGVATRILQYALSMTSTTQSKRMISENLSGLPSRKQKSIAGNSSEVKKPLTQKLTKKIKSVKNLQKELISSSKSIGKKRAWR